MTHSKTTAIVVLVGSLLTLGIGCSDDPAAESDAGPDGGDAAVGCAAYDMCLNYVVLCGGGDDDLEDCEKGFSGTDCTMTEEFCEGVLSAGTCAEAETYMGPYEAQYVGGTVSATCDEFCAKCEECKATYPAGFVEQDCGDYNIDSDTDSDTLEPCVPKCEADAELLGELQDLAVPLGEFGCCQVDYFF